MPPRRKKPRRLKPYEKMINFLDKYKELAALYDVPMYPNVAELYDPLIAKKSRKMPQMLQFVDDTIDPIGLRPLIEAYKQSDVRIRFLSFLNTETGDDGFHVLAHALDPPLELAGLAYHSNNVGPSGIRGFVRSMVNSKTLVILELDFNPTISDEGVLSLTHYGHCESLTKVSLRFCEIGDIGAEAIGRWIALDTCRLKEINLNGNKIGPKGAIGLGKGLAENKSLVRLDLSDNIFGYDPQALDALIDGINGCPTFQAINMLNRFECPEGYDQKLLELVQNKPLAECTLTVKMDTYYFQNAKAFGLINKRKFAKEARKARIEARKAALSARKAAKSGQTEPVQPQPNPAPSDVPVDAKSTQIGESS